MTLKRARVPDALVPERPVPRCKVHTAKARKGCQACTTHWAWRSRERTRRLAAGLPIGYRDPAATRDHLDALAQARVSLRTIQSRSGVGTGQICQIKAGKTRHVLATTERAILSVPVPDRPALQIGSVDGTGTTRRAQAMAADGWTYAQIGAVVDRSHGWAYRLAHNPGPVTAGTARRARTAYDDLTTRGPGPSAQAARLARRKRWHGSAWWPEHSIDDPDARPCNPLRRLRKDDVRPTAVNDALAGRLTRPDLTRAERIIVVRHLVAAGLTDAAIGRKLHWGNPTQSRCDAVQVFRARHGIACAPARRINHSHKRTTTRPVGVPTVVVVQAAA